MSILEWPRLFPVPRLRLSLGLLWLLERITGTGMVAMTLESSFVKERLTRRDGKHLRRRGAAGAEWGKLRGGGL